MEQTISLRETIEILLKGKWLILLITAIFVVTVAVYGYFIATPIYESATTITVAQREFLPQYSQLIKIPEVISKTKEQLKLQHITYEAFNDKIRIEIIKDTNLLRIYVKDQNPILASEIANTVTNNFIEYIKGYSLKENIAFYKYEIETLETELKIKNDTLLKLQQQLSGTPMYREVGKTLIHDPFLNIVVSEQQDRTTIETGAITFTEQVMNPVYETIELNIANFQVEIENIHSRISELQSQINQQSIAIKESVFVSSSALPPSIPIAPKNALNMAIASVFGFMVSIGLVFFVHYWRSTVSKEDSTSNI